MQFPQEINSHIAGFIADQVRAADPECYRSARRLQALCRGVLIRMRRSVCHFCARTDTAWTTRALYWVCGGCQADIAAGLVLHTHYDQHGFDSEGYDAEGYHQEGYDYHGFDRHGFDRQGLRYDDDVYRASLGYDDTLPLRDWDRYSSSPILWRDTLPRRLRSPIDWRD